MAEKQRILFVDDEPNVLAGLRRMLRSNHNEWQMEFAESGPQALDAFSRAHFDVIVSDMRMPGMSGAELLNEISNRFPHVIRIALSGQADKETLFRAVGPVHQFLSKPCDSETLKATVNRACALRSVMHNRKLKGLVSQMHSLPSLPSLYHKLMEEIQTPDASLRSIGDIISQDIGMASKVLQLVNSSFFGVKQRVSNPAQAVTLLGLEIIKSLVLSVHAFSIFNKVSLKGFSFDALWGHCMMVAAVAKNIVNSTMADKKTGDNAFVAGMLHDVGKLVLATKLPNEYGVVLSVAKSKDCFIYEAERKELDSSHADVGAYLIGLWGLPEALNETIFFHHHPSESLTKDSIILAAVHAADAMYYQVFSSGYPGKIPQLDMKYMTEMGLKNRIPVWEQITQETIRENKHSDGKNSIR